MRAPRRTLRSSFWITSLWACGQYQPERSRQPSMMSPTRIDRVGLVVAQEVEHQLRLAAAGAQMDVGQEDRCGNWWTCRGALGHGAPRRFWTAVLCDVVLRRFSCRRDDSRPKEARTGAGRRTSRKRGGSTWIWEFPAARPSSALRARGSGAPARSRSREAGCAVVVNGRDAARARGDRRGNPRPRPASK